jgi:branched-chain amino acid transport system substrate-binding protein
MGLFSITFVFALGPSSALSKEPIKIGLIRDLTGAHAEAGRSQVDAQKMIFDEINEKGGILGHKIDYVVGDEQASPDRAASLAKRYINVNDVLLISGTSTSGAGLALMKIASEEEVPVFGHAYSVKLHEGEIGKWYFASGSNNDGFIGALLHMANKEGLKKIGLIWVNYAWGRDAKDTAYKYAKQYGIEIIRDVPVEMGGAESTAEVSKIKDANPEAVIACVLTKDQAAVARALAALNWKPNFFGTSATMGPAMKIVGPELMEGWKGGFLCDPNAPRVVAIIDKFKAKYGSTPPDTTYFMEFWDATNVLVGVLQTLIEKGEPLTRSNLRDAMEKYSAGIDLLTPQARKSPGWGKPPHILIRAEDFLPMKIKGGQVVKY